jgi:hypothetical protein
VHDDMSLSPDCSYFLSGRAQWLQDHLICDASVTVRLKDGTQVDLVRSRYGCLRLDPDPLFSNMCICGTSVERCLCISKTRIVYMDMQSFPHILLI